MLPRALSILFTAALVGIPAHAADPQGSASVFLGLKALDADYWESVDRQPEFGVLLLLGRADWPVHVAVDFLAATDEGDRQRLHRTRDARRSTLAPTRPPSG